MIEHLSSERLMPGATPLEQGELEHLRQCARCRVERRLLRPPDAGLTESFARIEASLVASRASMTRSLGGTLVPEDLELTPSVLPELPDLERGRLEEQHLLGRGGMGEVFRARDAVLRRTVAMKVVDVEPRRRERAVARLVGEARIGAQLQHPGVVPVHDLGVLADGRVFFTMKEVDGQTLTEVIRRLHQVSSPRGWGEPTGGFTFRRVVDAFRRICETVAYAHARGVCHRDLKPDNLMLGAFGEVLVLDWGLAKIVGASEVAEGDLESVRDDAFATRRGSVAGTPSYMSPEQARGEADAIGPPTDVFALGAILYEILCGQRAYRAASAEEVMRRIQLGPPAPPSALGAPPPIPTPLEALCLQAMAADPPSRPESAREMADRVTAWLDGADRHARAVRVLEEARAEQPAARDARRRAELLKAEGERMLAAVPSHAPEAKKHEGWDVLETAREWASKARVHEARFLQKVQGALTHAPDLVEAHLVLADHYRAQHEAAERARDAGAAASAEVLLRAHDVGRHRRYLEGEGTLSLRVLPADATVSAFRFHEVKQRLVLRDTGLRWKGDLLSEPLSFGSYLFRISAPGRASIDVPVWIGRDEDVIACRPGHTTPWVVELPEPSELGAGECWVEAGWTELGGDALSAAALPAQRVWIDRFVMQQHPVTVEEYLVFLNDLWRTGRVEDAMKFAPRERPTRPGEEGELLVGFDPETGFDVVPDAQGDVWSLRWPVCMVSWDDARAYAVWRAQRDGLPWRLPCELEWEKAARGVDRRFWPWGNHGETTWANVDGAVEGRAMPCDVDAYHLDRSPYGVRGLGGNVSEWTLDAYRAEGPRVEDGLFLPPKEDGDPGERRVVRGGCWPRPVNWARSTFRVQWDAADRRFVIGFRLVRSV